MLLDFVRNGNTLVVIRIDQLARSMKDLQDILELRATELPIGGMLIRHT